MTQLRPKQIAQEGAALDDVLTWDGSKWAPAPASGGGAQWWQDKLTATGGEGGIELGQAPQPKSLQITLNGDPLDLTADYTLSGTTVTLGSTLTAADVLRTFYAYDAGLTGAAATLTGGFVPSDLSGLVFWIDASTLALVDGDPVSAWNDLSATGLNLAQGTSGKRPVYKTSGALPNSKPVVAFDGTDDALVASTNLGTLTSFSCFAVAAPTSATSPGTGGNIFQNGADTNIGLEFQANLMGALYGGIAHNTTAFGLAANTYFQQEAVRGSGTLTQWKDRVADPTTYTNTPGAPSGVLAVGAKDQAGGPFPGYWSGRIAEVVIYNRALTTLERQQVENYLAAKYGTP